MVEEESLAYQHPELMKEWNRSKNANFNPRKISSGCPLYVYWKCEQGHEWVDSIPNRVGGKGCPECKNNI